MMEERSSHRAPAGGQRPDLLSRLEALHPQPAPPPFGLRMLRKAWIGAYFILMFAPISVWMFFQWRIHSSERAAAVAALIAVPTCVIVIGVLLRLRTRLGAADALWAKDRTLRVAGTWVAGYASLWIAVYLAIMAAAVHRSAGPTEQRYVAAQVEECRARCRGCRLQATLEGHPRIDDSVCVEDVRPVPKAGDTLILSGYYSRDGIYITGVRRSVPVEAKP